jgi:hypothetical protein
VGDLPVPVLSVLRDARAGRVGRKGHGGASRYDGGTQSGGDGREDRVKISEPDTEWHNYATILAQSRGDEDRQVERSIQTIRSPTEILPLFFYMCSMVQ